LQTAQQVQAMLLEDFHDLAKVEDSMWYLDAPNQRMLIPLAELIEKEASILDAGCGTGGLIKAP
jgi:SAM-dependent methyltransferase